MAYDGNFAVYVFSPQDAGIAEGRSLRSELQMGTYFKHTEVWLIFWRGDLYEGLKDSLLSTPSDSTPGLARHKLSMEISHSISGN